MFVIIDDTRKVVDKASHEANLSRGYMLAGVAEGDDSGLTTAGYEKLEFNDPVDIDDTINPAKKVIQNNKKRAQIDLTVLEESLVDLSVKRDKAFQLNLTSLVTKLDSEIAQINTEIAAKRIIADAI